MFLHLKNELKETRKSVEVVWNILVLEKCFIFLEMKKMHG